MIIPDITNRDVIRYHEIIRAMDAVKRQMRAPMNGKHLSSLNAELEELNTELDELK